MNTQSPHVALLIMVKNEKKRLRVTLNSVVGFINSIVAYDTGSTDDTIEILENFSKEHKIPLHLKQGEFVDFCTSRNVSLEFADTFPDIEYLLLMDCNDELKGGEHFRKYLQNDEFKKSTSTGFLICQEWWGGKLDKYYNMRFVKAHEGWRYRGSVHEWMKNTKYEDGYEPPVTRLPDTIVLYQDRTQDDDKSSKRFIRDKMLLLKEHEENPKDERTVFYLAQTLGCLGEMKEAYNMYILRTQMESFQEEKFHAFLRCGELSQALNYDWHVSLTWYMKAIEHSLRAEPMLRIADHYIIDKNWIMAFTFTDLACKLLYPEQCILFVDRGDYDYKRWHMMGIIGFYTKNFVEGKEACKRAIATGINVELDKSNLQFYLDAEENDRKGKLQFEKEKIMNDPNITKKDFIGLQMNRLHEENPTLTTKQLETKAQLLWKIKNKK
uniref:Glycosyltransferase 2-like domain-containing protein n=1 Tax=viral metagenome TaxID=1070528 RepID=A0A6C0D131_9ZZZZ